MKAKELMIGDWVRHELTQEIWQWSSEDYSRVDADVCQPIPLTYKILEANGFGFQRGTLWYQKSDPFVEVNKFEVHISEVTTVIVEHVHQLQQAMRLCGLNDLADNMKVE